MPGPPPTLLREIDLSLPLDPDWALTQALPPVEITASAEGLRSVRIIAVPRNANATVDVASDLQLVVHSIARGGASPREVVWADAVGSVACGGSCGPHDLQGAERFTARLVDKDALVTAGATTLFLYWVPA